MEMLHTPAEIVRLSNIAHVAEGILLLVIACVLLAQAFGYLQFWKRYLLPAVALLASFTLASFLFVGHGSELAKAFRVITNDMQQKQHLQMGVLIGFGAIGEFVAVRLKNKWLHLMLPLALGMIGGLFLSHPQHGSSETAYRGLVIRKVAGTTLIIAALCQAGAALWVKSQKVLLLVAAAMLTIGAVSFLIYREPLMDMNGIEQGIMRDSNSQPAPNMKHMGH